MSETGMPERSGGEPPAEGAARAGWIGWLERRINLTELFSLTSA